MSWHQGYVTDLLYTYGYYPELNPLNTRLLFLASGIACKKEFKTACELGFGQGMSINIHAAASKTSWYGNDFNPAQVDFAQDLAQKADLNVHLYDDSFQEFLDNDELPNFDFIGLHGIWAWVNEDCRQAILKFIEKKLNVGGVVYCSYNIDPGYTPFSPIQHLMKTYNDLYHHGSANEHSVNDSIGFIQKLFKANSKYAINNPLLEARFNLMATQDRHYLAHEFFNGNWTLAPFDEIAKGFEEVKLQFAVSADAKYAVTPLNLTEEQASILDSIEDRNFRETVQDFMLCEQFRRDYYVKGLRYLEPKEQEQQLKELKIILKYALNEFDYKVKGCRGEIGLEPSIYDPILECIKDGNAHSILEISNKLEKSAPHINFGLLISSLLILSAKGTIALAQEPSKESINRCHKLNDFILEKATTLNPIKFLASPVTGGGILVGQINQILLQALKNKRITLNESELIKFVGNLIVVSQGNVKDNGQTIDPNTAQGQESIKKIASTFIESVKIYKALKLID